MTDVISGEAERVIEECRCPRCDGALPPQKSVGRPRIWCSERCRKAGWSGRGDVRAAESQVVQSPEATERLLRLLADSARRGELNSDQWCNVRAAAAVLATFVNPA